MQPLRRTLPYIVHTIVLVATTAHAEPELVTFGAGIRDMTSDGQAVVGFVYDRPMESYAVVRFTRGIGQEQISGAVVGGNGILRCSDNADAIALEMENLSDWGDLNCFDSNFDPPYAEPCPFIPAISHHWTETTGWVNCGSFPYNEVIENYSCDSGTPTPVTVRVGGTRCDYTINSPNDISGDGRYIIGAGWFATSDPRASGCAPFGFCGDYYPFRWDSTAQSIEMLTVQPGTTTARADTTNSDGTVIVGYDLGTSADPDGPGGPIEVFETRRLCVWRNGVQSLLDPYGHRGSPPVSSDGLHVASQSSPTLTRVLYGPPANPEDNLYYTRLIRWNWNGVSWAPEDLGKPALYNGFPAIQIIVTSISADGNTIVGSVGYGTQDFGPALTWRLFIWRPTINGGVPTDLQTYLRSQVQPGNTTYDEDEIWLYDVRELSADGNAMVVNFLTRPKPDNCLDSFQNGIVYLNGTTCEPPTVELDSTAIVRDEAPVFPAEVINCRATGSWPLSYQWQRRDLFTAEWVDVVDDEDPECIRPIGYYRYQGSKTSQLRFGLDDFFCDGGAGDYRCLVTNACGSATSDIAHVSIIYTGTVFQCGGPPGDMTSDFFVDILDLPDFVSSLLGLPFDPGNFFAVDRADVNLDGRKDGHDVQAFMELLIP